MRIVDFLSAGDVLPAMAGTTGEEILREFCRHLARAGSFPDEERLLAALLEREKLGSTGVGEGVAIPHARLAGLSRLLLAFGRSAGEVPFGAADGRSVRLFFLLAAPEDSAGLHLKVLARVSRLLKDPGCRRALLAAGGADDLFRVIAEEDARI